MNSMINIAGLLLYAFVMAVLFPLLVLVKLIIAAWKFSSEVNYKRIEIRIPSRFHWKPVFHFSLAKARVRNAH
jgi:hypothetical protein